MSEGFICRRGGGAGLNFAVKAYPSVDSLPDSAAYNTIALITETKVADWCFSDNEPTGLTEGSVWIPTGKGSVCSFNALKKRGACIAVYPLSAMQYISGALMNIEAFIYNGAWVQFGYLMVYLYKNGETSHAWQGTGTDTSAELIMQISRGAYNGGYGSYGHKYTSNKVAIPSGLSKLSVKYYCEGTPQDNGTPIGAFVLRADYSDSTCCSNENVVASVSIPYTTAESVVSLDVPESLYGQELYVGAYYHSNANATADFRYHIKEIWFE